MPEKPPFVSGKPTFDTKGLDPKGLEHLKRTVEYMEKNKMKPEEGKFRPPYDFKSGKPLFDTKGINDKEINAGLEMMKRISPNGE